MEQLISASGTQYGLIVNADGSLNVSGVSVTVSEPVGYDTTQIIRQSVGSPATNFIFNSLAQSFMIDNLGSSSIYFAFNIPVDPAGSATGYLDKFTFRSFDAQVGSISIQSSGTSVSVVQCIKLS